MKNKPETNQTISRSHSEGHQFYHYIFLWSPNAAQLQSVCDEEMKRRERRDEVSDVHPSDIPVFHSFSSVRESRRCSGHDTTLNCAFNWKCLFLRSETDRVRVHSANGRSWLKNLEWIQIWTMPSTWFVVWIWTTLMVHSDWFLDSIWFELELNLNYVFNLIWNVQFEVNQMKIIHFKFDLKLIWKFAFNLICNLNWSWIWIMHSIWFGMNLNYDLWSEFQLNLSYALNLICDLNLIWIMRSIWFGMNLNYDVWSEFQLNLNYAFNLICVLIWIEFELCFELK